MSANSFPLLQELTGFAFPVYTSFGTHARAEIIATRTQQAQQYLGAIFGFEPQLHLLVLAPQDWEGYSTFPTYGMPHCPNRRTLVVAGENNQFWDSMTPPLDQLPPLIVATLRATYGLPNGEIELSPFFDLLAVHELAHLFHQQAGLRFPRIWLMELFCNLALHAYVANVEAEQLAALEIFPQAVADYGYAHLEHHRLGDLERLYPKIAAHNFHWYQAMWHVAAQEIYDAGGVEVLMRLWKTFLRTPYIHSNDKLAQLLSEQVHPQVARVLTEWPV